MTLIKIMEKPCCDGIKLTVDGVEQFFMKECDPCTWDNIKEFMRKL